MRGTGGQARARWLAAALCLVVVAAAPAHPAAAAPASAWSSPAQPTSALAGFDPSDPLGIGSAISGLAGGVASSSASVLLGAVSSWVAEGTSSLIGSLATVIDRHTKPDVEAGWLRGHYASMAGIALLLALPLLLAAAITAVARQDAAPLLKAAFIHLPLAAIGTGVAIDLVNLGLAATDELCALVSGSAARDTDHLLSGLQHILDRGLPGAGGFALVLVCLLVAFGAFFVTIEMIVRSAAVSVAMLFLPLALAGLVWPATSRWARRLAETLAVLILSKFVVVAIISMAIAAVGDGLAGDGVSSLLSGAALLILAGAAPFTLLRMVPVVEAGVVGHLDGVGRSVAPSAPVTSRDVVGRLLNMGGERPGSTTSEPGQLETARSTRPLDADGGQGGPGRPSPGVGPIPATGDAGAGNGAGGAGTGSRSSIGGGVGGRGAGIAGAGGAESDVGAAAGGAGTGAGAGAAGAAVIAVPVIVGAGAVKATQVASRHVEDAAAGVGSVPGAGSVDGGGADA